MSLRVVLFLLVALFLAALAGCVGRTEEQSSAAPGPNSQALSSATNSPCMPTDQDRYVWRSSRLQLIQPCIRVTGMVVDVATSGGADGDIHMDIRVDPPYEALLTEGSKHNDGYLIVEAVCQFPPPQMEALRICASDPDPYLGPFPRSGDHIWVEGRYVLDLQHYAWAELHPLYRWGVIQP